MQTALQTLQEFWGSSGGGLATTVCCVHAGDALHPRSLAYRSLVSRTAMIIAEG